MNLTLTKLSLKDQDNIRVYNLLQSLPPKEHGFINNAYGLTFKQFQQWIIDQEKASRGIDVPEDRVPQTYFWLYDGEACIGLGKVRHKLNEKLKNHGGNIGYAIHPDHRGQGFGTKLLNLLLKEASKTGISQALVTCSTKNIPSQKVIEKNGGVLHSKTPTTHRYFISIK